MKLKCRKLRVNIKNQKLVFPEVSFAGLWHILFLYLFPLPFRCIIPLSYYELFSKFQISANRFSSCCVVMKQNSQTYKLSPYKTNRITTYESCKVVEKQFSNDSTLIHLLINLSVVREAVTPPTYSYDNRRCWREMWMILCCHIN